MQVRKTVNGRSMIWSDDELDWKEEEPKALLAPPTQPYLFIVEPLQDYEIKGWEDPSDEVYFAYDLEAQKAEAPGALQPSLWPDLETFLFGPDKLKRGVSGSSTGRGIRTTPWFGGDAA